MGKTKDAAGSSKSKKAKTVSTSREVAIPENEPVRIPTWRTGPLSNFDPRVQPTLWQEKMKELDNSKDAFIVEREVSEELFGHHGVHERFERLGWGAALHCYDEEKDRLFAPLIEEWIMNLSLEGTNNKRTMKLVGMVRGTKVTMSMAILQKIAPFDSLPIAEYGFPHEDHIWGRPDKSEGWELMKETVFEPGKAASIKRADLRREARLMQTIITSNVMPRRGDKDSVRFCDIPILYSLMTGQSKTSFCYIAMMNIWLARVTKKKLHIPHCRLIQALLKHFKVCKHSSYERGDFWIEKDMAPFDVRFMSKVGWEWSTNDRYAVWKYKSGEIYRVRRLDAMRDDDDEEEEEEEEPIRIEAEGPRPPFPMSDDMWSRIQASHPQGYDMWPSYNRCQWDQSQYGIYQAHDDSLAEIENTNRWNRINLFHQEVQVNNTWESQQRLGYHEAYHQGLPITPAPPMIDYSTLPPYDGGQRLPRPEWHHSEWIDPYQYREQLELQRAQELHQQRTSGEGSSSSQQQQQPDDDSINFRSWEQELFGSFGQRQNRYYGGNL